MVHSYTTRDAEKKLLGKAMRASKQKNVSKKRLRNAIVVEPDIPKDQVVNVEEDEEINWTESEEEEIKKSLDLGTQKKIIAKGKGRESVSSRGPNSHTKRRKT